MTLRIFGHPCYFGHPPISFLLISPRADATFSPSLSPRQHQTQLSIIVIDEGQRKDLLAAYLGGEKKRQKNPNQKLPSRACVDRDRRLRRRVWNPAGLVYVPTYLRVGGPSFVSNSKIGLDQLRSRCLLSLKGPSKKDQRQTISQRRKKGEAERQIIFRRFVPSSSSLPTATHAYFFIRFLR